MILRYGEYAHPNNQSSFSIIKLGQYSEQMIKESVRHVVTCRGYMEAASAGNLTTQLQSLESNYNEDGKDLVFYDNDGQRTILNIIAADTLFGTRIVQPPSFIPEDPYSPNTTYAAPGWQQFQLQVAAEYDNPGGELVAWGETLKEQGTGGVRFELIDVILGPAVVQHTGTHSQCLYIQEGFAIGKTAPPTAPSQIWPSWQDHERNEKQVSTPRIWKNGRYRNWAIAWRYYYKSPLPLFGNPTLPPSI